MTGAALSFLLVVLAILILASLRHRRFTLRLKKHLELLYEVFGRELTPNKISLEKELDEVDKNVSKIKKLIDENRDLKERVNRLERELSETRAHLENKISELNALFDFATTVGQLNDGVDIYRLIPASIEQHIGLEEVAIFKLDEDSNKLVAAGSSFGLEKKLEGKEFDINDPIVGKVFLSGEPIFVPDTFRRKTTRESILLKDAGSLIAYPIKKRDRVVGVFTITHPKANAFDGETLAMVKALTRFISIALENSELYNYAKMMAERDSLTHLYNHGTFHSRLKYELERAGRYERPLSVIMFDIDGFKLINDNFGHAVGDRVLKMVAGIINAHIRKTDIPARYGGDEFAILLPETDVEAAKIITQRIRDGLSSISMDTEKGGSIHISASFGVTSCGPKTPGREKVVEVADKLMYQAKSRGYGQIECSPM